MTFDHWNLYRSSAEIRELAEAWVTEPRPEGAEYTDVDEELNRWLHDEPDKALAAICAIAQVAEAPETLALLAAGPLENFLCIHEDKVFEKIRSLAHEHDVFRQLLGGVWQLTMSKVFYQKVRGLGAGRL